MNGQIPFGEPSASTNLMQQLPQYSPPKKSLPTISPATFARSSSSCPNNENSLGEEFGELTLETPSCPECKGHKYGFTAYFHNAEIFSRPPHELLAYVEEAYLQREKLQSLLVTYAKRVPEANYAAESERFIRAWGGRVQCLVRALFDKVLKSGFSLSEDGEMKIEALITWTKDVVKQLSDTVWGRLTIHLFEEDVKRMLFVFRKLWEGVWIAYLTDQKSAVDRRGGQLMDSL